MTDPVGPHKTPERYADANGIRLCYDSFGVPSDPALLLVMGLGSQMIAWDDAFCAQLAGHGFHVVRFDNRDIGRSTRFDAAGVPRVRKAMLAAVLGRPIRAPYLLRDMAEDARGLLDHLGIDRAHVVGASMGGAIAQLLAAHHPQRVRSLTSVMATSGAPGLPPPKLTALALLTRPAPTDLAGFTKHYRKTWQVLRAGHFAPDESRDAERAARIHSRGLNPAGAARQTVAILASGSRKAALSGVTVPTLVIHGNVDPLIPVECGIDVARTVPGAKLVVIEGMGHALPISMWPQIIDAIASHAAAAA
ncbi:MAG: alpha/beta hydrolase [Burkholderiaceae bacterium]